MKYLYSKFSYSIIFLIGLLSVLCSCAQKIYPPKVKKRTEIEYRYKTNKDFEVSKWLKTKRLIDYEIYDTNSNVIEIDRYGELFSTAIQSSVHSNGVVRITYGDSWNYKKIGSVVYYKYNSNGQLVMEEVWNIKNNKKDYLIWKKLYNYDTTGFLINEIEYNQYNKIKESTNYLKINQFLIIRKDTTYSYSSEGFQNIESQGIDSIFVNSQNDPVKKIHYFQNKFLYEEKFEYNESNELIKKLRYDENKELWCIDEWKYNSKNQIILKFHKFTGTSSEYKNIYLYNKHNLLKKILYYENDKLIKYSIFKYKYFKQ